MADISAEIETLEHRLMRAWMRQDKSELKAVIARSFMMLVAGKKSLVLDRTSWLEAAGTRMVCTGYQIGDLYVRKHGSGVLLAGRFELEMLLDNEVWSGTFWVTDLWRKSSITRKWRLAERILSRPDD
ncbi:MAG: nuclear transport factor 2 family protein, partial [Sphingomicrobium sp.]